MKLSPDVKGSTRCIYSVHVCWTRYQIYCIEWM